MNQTQENLLIEVCEALQDQLVVLKEIKVMLEPPPASPVIDDKHECVGDVGAIDRLAPSWPVVLGETMTNYLRVPPGGRP